MSVPRSALEVFRLLEKSNCRQCGEKTCLALAGAVFTGRRKLRESPGLSQAAMERFAGGPDAGNTDEQSPDEHLQRLKSQVARLDLAEAAGRVGGRYSGGRLTLEVLVKDFGVNAEGNLSAEIHVNPWVAVPFLVHVLHGERLPPAGRWVPFRELRGRRERYPPLSKTQGGCRGRGMGMGCRRWK